MAKNLPPLNWFAVFETSARHLNFTAAADELGMTQSAVSQQIKALETRLGTQLFLRRARGLSLTDEGRKLLPMVGASLDQLKSAANLFLPNPSPKMITVAASVSISQWVIAPHLAAYTAAHPNMNIRFVGTIWADEFQNRVADVEIRFGPERVFSTRAKRIPDQLIAVAPPTCDLTQTPIIETVGATQGWSNWSKLSGIMADRKPTLYVDSYGLVLNLAEQGAGMGLVSSVIAKSALSDGRVSQIGDAAIIGSEGYFLDYDPNNENAKEFCDWFLSVL